MEVWEVAKPTVTAQFKMEDGCILGNVIEFFWHRTVNKIKRGRPYGPLKFHMVLAHSCKKHQLVCLNIQTLQLLKWGID